MIKIITALCMLSGLLFAIEWEKALDSALQKAQKEHKTIMVLVEGKHCGWCKKMKSRTLSNKQVEQRLANYVAVKVMRTNGKEMTKLPSVNGVPTIFFMTENGTVVEDVVGYFDVNDFISYVNDAEKKVKK